MNTDDLGQSPALEPLPEKQRRRGWWSRNWLWFVPTVLLVFIVLCCGCPVGIFGVAYNKVFEQVTSQAMPKIEANERLRQELGEPITSAFWPLPAFQLEERDMDVRWNIQGPKGEAKAHMKARLMKDRWETVILEVVLADGKKVPLEGEGDAPPFDAPKFEAPKADAKKAEAEGPPPQIKIPTDMP
jgi:hypothetical protein